jgi:hypothetical protein
MNRGMHGRTDDLEVSGCLLRPVLLSGTAAGRYFTGTCRLAQRKKASRGLHGLRGTQKRKSCFIASEIRVIRVIRGLLGHHEFP